MGNPAQEIPFQFDHYEAFLQERMGLNCQIGPWFLDESLKFCIKS